MSIGAFYRLTRFEHAIMLAIAVLIAEVVVLGAFPTLSLLLVLSLLVPVFSEMGSFALNDYLDVESDRINKRIDRPLVTGEINPKFAFYFSIISIVISVVLAYFINFYAFLIALIFNGLAVLYNYELKDIALVGNIYIALTMAIPFIFGNFIYSNSLNTVVFIIAALGFLSGLAREIIKSVEDMEGDRKARGSRTLPIIIGEKNSRYFAVVLFLVFLPLSILPFNFGLKFSVIPILLVSVADFGIIYLIKEIVTSGDKVVLKKARKLSLIVLFLGLLGLLLAAV
ncbi:UbiA family prenyltransferase [Candidatus Micrarchaeota archaeon]|nr:UbiA family prenyltransferase [Candidatus Micrarchaeota archaeon]